MTATVPKPPRYGFLDLYRGIVVLFMLQGHVFREVLTPELRRSSLFMYHELFHGITAPGFLFGAGFTFAIASQRKWDQLVTWSPGLFKRIWRLLLLIGIGYALHIPFLSLHKSLAMATAQQWQEFFNFDALQCIALTLLLLRLTMVIVRQERRFLLSTMVLMLLVVYGTPFVWHRDVHALLAPHLAGVFNGMEGSLFPLFPYAGYVFAGALVSWSFLRAAAADKDDEWMKRLAILGVLLMVAGFAFEAIPVGVYPRYDFWNASPNYFWTKLGFLLLLLSALWVFEETLLVQHKPHVWMPQWLTALGIESLFVYILHLILLYGWVLNAHDNISTFWASRLGVPEAVAVVFGLTVFCALAALLWQYLKKQHPVLMKGLYWWMGLSFLYAFLVNPY